MLKQPTSLSAKGTTRKVRKPLASARKTFFANRTVAPLAILPGLGSCEKQSPCNPVPLTPDFLFSCKEF